MPAKKITIIKKIDDILRVENKKTIILAKILHKRKLISDQDLKSLVSMEPFAQLA